MTTRTICILGGTGFVGGHLLARLAADGHDLRVLTRSRARNRHLLVLPTVSLIEANVHDQATLQRHFDGCDAVINLVGILNERERDGSGFHRVHVELVQKVIAACLATGVEQLTHMGALKAEQDAPSKYLRSKAEARAALREAAGEQLSVTILEPSVIFGPGDSFINRFADLLRLPSPFVPLPRANARFAPVYVGDVVEAFALALRPSEARSRTWQLCGPRVYSLREIIELTARTMGLRRTVVKVPDSVARLQARLMEFVPGKPFSLDNYRSLTVHSICDKNALAQLGITPTSLEVTLPHYLGGHPQRHLDQLRRRAGGAL